MGYLLKQLRNTLALHVKHCKLRVYIQCLSTSVGYFDNESGVSSFMQYFDLVL